MGRASTKRPVELGYPGMAQPDEADLKDAQRTGEVLILPGENEDHVAQQAAGLGH